MKHSIYIVLILGLLATTMSCDNAINKAPIDQLSPEKLFVDEANAETAVRGVYRSLESAAYYGNAFVVIPEFAAGHMRHYLNFPEFVEYRENRIRVDNVWATSIWSAAYTAINNANNVIKSVPTMTGTISEDRKKQFVNEAKFVRALCYFNLVRSFGDVPVVLEPTPGPELKPLLVSRVPVADVYKQIVQDLQDATALPTKYADVASTKGRATSNAAKALLAKVYLYQKEYKKSSDLAKDVIANGGYTLTQDYGSIWTTKNSSESIFELQFDEQATNNLAQLANPAGATQFFASDSAVLLFEKNDKRRSFTINTVTLSTGVVHYLGKERNVNPPTQNITVIRLSEILLIQAEAQAMSDGTITGDAYKNYKLIRDRAGLTTPAETSFARVADFVKAIQREKRVELMFESEAWYDYQRTGLALTEMMYRPVQNRYLFPIPQIERDLNSSLSQNAAYL